MLHFPVTKSLQSSVTSAARSHSTSQHAGILNGEKLLTRKLNFYVSFFIKFQQTFGFENQTQLVLCMRKWDGKQYQDKGKEPVWRGDRAVFILQSYNSTTVQCSSSHPHSFQSDCNK